MISISCKSTVYMFRFLTVLLFWFILFFTRQWQILPALPHFHTSGKKPVDVACMIKRIVLLLIIAWENLKKIKSFNWNACLTYWVRAIPEWFTLWQLTDLNDLLRQVSFGPVHIKLLHQPLWVRRTLELNTKISEKLDYLITSKIKRMGRS